ncbi:MAG: hypothetical protein OEM24_08365 [Paracoccaceae bacterium]|nr:hypothetical protein [Paracoccaceae bacterium]
MRILALCALCVFAALPARARDCGAEMPRGFPDHAFAYRDVIDCLLGEIAALRREEARLARRVGELEAALAAIPADYVNLDGKAEVPEGRPVGRARFVLSARQTGGTAAMALDMAVVEALCGGPGGCTLALARRALGLRRAEAGGAEGVGPCLFLYDPGNGAWFRAAGCDGGGAEGVDGDGGPLSGTGSGGEILAEAGQVCLLADSDASPRLGPEATFLGGDHGPGLFLIAAPARGGETGSRFRCELDIE